MGEDELPSEERTIEEIKALLRAIPKEAIKPPGCAIDAAKTKGVTKYVYPALEDVIMHKIQGVIKTNGEVIGDVVYDCHAMRSGETKCDNKIEIAAIHAEECKSLALYHQINSMKKQIKRDNTKINSLMNAVDRQRARVSQWDSSDAS